METNRLRQFCVIVETGSLSRAAELLRITHSGLSKSMTNFQEELKLPLIQPNGRGIAITQDGLRIYQNAKVFLESEQKLFFSREKDQSDEFRIGTVEIFSKAITDGLKNSSIEHERLKIVDIEPGAIEQQINAGNLDIGITYLPFSQPNLKLISLGKFKLGCFHRNDVFQDVDFQELPFVVPAKLLPENPQGIKERDGWHDSLLPRKIAFKTNLLSIAIDLTMAGLAAIIIPYFVADIINQSLASSEKKLKERLLPSRPPNFQQTAYVICSERYSEDHRLRSVCKIVRSAIRQSI
jgi:DNA-binding transcriptional LysR family regulator